MSVCEENWVSSLGPLGCPCHPACKMLLVALAGSLCVEKESSFDDGCLGDLAGKHLNGGWANPSSS